MFKDKIANMVKDAVINSLKDNKDAIKDQVAKALDETDMPFLPDDIEAPIDELIEIGFNTLLDQLVAFLENLT